MTTLLLRSLLLLLVGVASANPSANQSSNLLRGRNNGRSLSNDDWVVHPTDRNRRRRRLRPIENDGEDDCLMVLKLIDYEDNQLDEEVWACEFPHQFAVEVLNGNEFMDITGIAKDVLDAFHPISGASILNTRHAFVEQALDTKVMTLIMPEQAQASIHINVLDETHPRHYKQRRRNRNRNLQDDPNNRALQARLSPTGEMSVLVVKVVDTNGLVNPLEATMSEDWFGTSTFTFKSGFEQCSHNQLIMKPATNIQVPYCGIDDPCSNDAFCNFDYETSGFCEDCPPNESSCSRMGLPVNGVADCKSACAEPSTKIRSPFNVYPVDTIIGGGGCDVPTNKANAMKSMGFTKVACPYGILITGTNNYRDDYLQLGANIIASILDQDSDGVVDDPELVGILTYKGKARGGAVLQCGITQTEEQKGDSLGENNLFDYAFSCQTWKAEVNNLADVKGIMMEEAFHMIHQLGYAVLYPAELGMEDFKSSVIGRELSRLQCVSPGYAHPENKCPNDSPRPPNNPASTPLPGTCNDPSCDVAEFYKMILFLAIGMGETNDPSGPYVWTSLYTPTKQNEVLSMLSTEFKDMISTPSLHQLSAPLTGEYGVVTSISNSDDIDNDNENPSGDLLFDGIPQPIGGCVSSRNDGPVPDDIWATSAIIYDDKKYPPFTKYVMTRGIILAATDDDITDIFLNKVTTTLNQMIPNDKNNKNINRSDQEKMMVAMARKRNLIPVVLPGFFGRFTDAENNQFDTLRDNFSICDSIHYQEDGLSQTMEVVEHLLHFINMVGLHFLQFNEWGIGQESKLYDELKTSCSQGFFNYNGCASIGNNGDDTDRVLLQEYGYWLIATWMNLVEPYGPSDVENEWKLFNPSLLMDQQSGAYNLCQDNLSELLAVPKNLEDYKFPGEPQQETNDPATAPSLPPVTDSSTGKCDDRPNFVWINKKGKKKNCKWILKAKGKKNRQKRCMKRVQGGNATGKKRFFKYCSATCARFGKGPCK